MVGATEAAVRIPALAAAECAGFRPDFVLVTVKSGDTSEAARTLDRALGPRPPRVSLQNGLGNEEILAAGGAPVIGAVTNNGATLRASGEVFHAGIGEVLLGGSPGEAARRLAACLVAVGLPARAVEDIGKPLWDKAILNAAVNPVTALLGLRTGELLADPGRALVVRRLVDEGCRVARAAGADCAPAEVLAQVRRVAARTPENRSSMLQDLERGRATEIGAISGVIGARGRAAGIPTPWNDLMVRLIREREPVRP